MALCIVCRCRDVSELGEQCDVCTKKRQAEEEVRLNEQKYAAAVKELQVRQNGNSAIVTLYFSQEVKVRERKTQKENLNKKNNGIFGMIFGGNKQLQTDFEINTITRSENRIWQNQFNISMTAKTGSYFTRTISGGNFDFIGGTDSGYLVSVSIQNNDYELMRIIMQILRKMGFACQLSNYSIDGIKTDHQPTVTGERLAIEEFVNVIKQKLEPKERKE